MRNIRRHLRRIPTMATVVRLSAFGVGEQEAWWMAVRVEPRIATVCVHAGINTLADRPALTQALVWHLF